MEMVQGVPKIYLTGLLRKAFCKSLKALDKGLALILSGLDFTTPFPICKGIQDNIFFAIFQEERD